MKEFNSVVDFCVWRKSLTNSPVVVPTMGALHEGHATLIREAAKSGKPVVVWIFVNPIQFNQQSDLEAYPRTYEADRDLCKNLGVAAILSPSASELYPQYFTTFCEVGSLDTGLCGATRPGHFRGVCTVVLKLFNIIQPSAAYFGKKDFQQLRIIERMVRDLNLPIHIHRVDTVREADGLAMSSRNRRLTPDYRSRAPALFRGLQEAKHCLQNGIIDAAQLIENATLTMNEGQPFKLDYLQIVDQETLQPIAKVDTPALMAVAAFFGEVRLIDNIEL